MFSSVPRCWTKARLFMASPKSWRQQTRSSTIAAEARRRAEQFPHQRDDIARRLVAGRTHLDARTTGSAGSGLAALGGYIQLHGAIWTRAPVRFQAALDDADDALEQAQASARRLAYPPALRLLEHARVALTRADEQVRLVTGRLATLDALQADPSAPIGPVQFALDDAQLLCAQRATRPDPRRLDALARPAQGRTTLDRGRASITSAYAESTL